MNKTKAEEELEFQDALSLKRAELWVEVGRRELAFSELRELSDQAWGHPWARRVVESLEGGAIHPAPAGPPAPLLPVAAKR